jgi:hypothetical protein
VVSTGDVIQRVLDDAGAGIRPKRSGVTGVLLAQDLAELPDSPPLRPCPWTTIAHPN